MKRIGLLLTIGALLCPTIACGIFAYTLADRGVTPEIAQQSVIEIKTFFLVTGGIMLSIGLLVAFSGALRATRPADGAMGAVSALSRTVTQLNKSVPQLPAPGVSAYPPPTTYSPWQEEPAKEISAWN